MEAKNVESQHSYIHLKQQLHRFNTLSDFKSLNLEKKGMSKVTGTLHIDETHRSPDKIIPYSI